MKKSKIIISTFLIFILVFLLCIPTYASGYTEALTYNGRSYKSESSVGNINQIKNKQVYVGGMPFGVRILSKGLRVVGFSESDGTNNSAAYESGIRLGDVITKINNVEISTIEDFALKMNENGSKPVTLTVERDNSQLEFTFTPKYYKEDNSFKSGLWLRDSTSGIGTVTFIDPETGIFGGLGHGICDSSTGSLVPLSKGIIMDVTINGVNKGKVGSAGELKGCFNVKRMGSLLKNTNAGVFGIITSNKVTSPEEKMNLGTKEELKEGDAYIWCTLADGVPKKYAVKISDIDTSCSSVKNFRVKVVDPVLLSKTGGIVQGMSGSPIIQNGKLVGAVTHVLINDPTSGYGIFIENMLNQIKDLS